MIEEAEATCPHCWESISLALDLSVGPQDYIEDCPVCCHPMMVLLLAEDGRLIELRVERAAR